MRDTLIPPPKKYRGLSPEEGTEDKPSQQTPMITRQLVPFPYPPTHVSIDSFSVPQDLLPESTSISPSPFLLSKSSTYLISGSSYHTVF